MSAVTGNSLVGVEMTLTPDPGETLSADEVTDLIETIIDALDEAGFIPNVFASGEGDGVQLNVEVVVATPELTSFEAGVAAITKAVAHAGLEMDPPPTLSGIHASLRALEPA